MESKEGLWKKAAENRPFPRDFSKIMKMKEGLWKKAIKSGIIRSVFSKIKYQMEDHGGKGLYEKLCSQG